ncbi:hypothetical protein BITS_1524 [Bifidobacterium tsurumiense]|uniref:Uncharacterized protein n=1 Tax=Bifidobacterium tsurumiense TaxID=356829 RepID=A0A087EH47_9BIFI|nr:hypothetical protein BITS_1524 [Bifidobacterium tsurumiense]
MGESECGRRGAACHALIYGREEIVQKRLSYGIGLALALISGTLFIEVLGVENPCKHIRRIGIEMLEILIKVEGVGPSVFLLHICSDDVQVVEIHGCIDFRGDLLAHITAGVLVLRNICTRCIIPE